MEQVHVPEPKAKPSYRLLPNPENPSFRGKQQTLIRMTNALRPTSSRLKLYALYELGGVGKTQLALQFTYSHLDIFNSIFWIPAQTSSQITQRYIEAAQNLSLLDPVTVIDEDKAVKGFMSWLSSSEDWLIVFDNVDDIDVLAPSGHLLRTVPYLLRVAIVSSSNT
ncbi:hypothetical protein F4821DRAFT_265981 [Hypoxylon rubiginosum]|uniref:Uncharacterized protein n=1 Tax=Hypoxylon rubiginosum TaxID=110542 RepID=A0ACC0CJ09_9PEZI|nr:hypothetical protein F4821DRAFT_265981 [Hypoxylon rubiginosum]